MYCNVLSFVLLIIIDLILYECYIFFFSSAKLIFKKNKQFTGCESVTKYVYTYTYIYVCAYARVAASSRSHVARFGAKCARACFLATPIFRQDIYIYECLHL